MDDKSAAGMPGAELPTGTVTFLFTDIAGSTALLKQLGESYSVLLADQRAILRAAFTRWNGQEVDTQGDAFFVSFPRATEAVNACVEIQRALAEHEWPEGVEVRVRMGLHTGEPWRAEEGYVGMDVHRAARIAHVGHGGQVLLSETTTALIVDELPGGASLVDLGRHLLKDLPRPEHIRQLAIEGLPAEFPPLTSIEKLPAVELRERREVGACPYRGLAAFREQDAEFFFGREDFTARLREAVKTHPLIAVVVGSSGSGKSSAVYAGLLPELRGEEGWAIAQFRPGNQPLHTLVSALLPTLEPGLSPAERLVEARKLADALGAGDLALHDVVSRAFEAQGDIDHILLVVDQFEELYTLCQDEAERGRFKDELLDAVLATGGRRTKRFVLLLTLRADFMGQALTHRPFADALQEASLLMGPMTREELRSAVEKPAEMQGAVFEAGLVERILDDVGEKPGNLPLLEFALTLLWEAQSDGWLTHTDYEAIGGVEGALARYADEVFEGLEAADQGQARRIFVQLVKPGEGTEDTRRVATRAELAEADWGLVQHLADKRLVVTGRDVEGRETVEVVHEALIQGWGRFQDWMGADRDFRSWQERLRTSLRVWETSARDEQALLRGLALDEAERWRAERGAELSGAEARFIQASLAERDARREAEQARQARENRLERTRRVLARVLIGVLGVGLAVALGLTYFAFGQRDEAQRSEAQALLEAEARAAAESEALKEADARATAQADAEAQEHAALLQASIGLSSQAALELRGTSPERAVPLALEALENYPYTWQAERALGEAVFSNHLELILEQDAWVNTAVWSPDQTRILTASDDETSRVWDAVTGDLLFTFEHDDLVISALWSPIGDRILTITNGDWDVEGVLNIWDSRTGELIRSIPLGVGRFWEADWSHDGEQIIVSNRSGITGVWDALTGEMLFTLAGHKVCGSRSCTVGVRAWSPSGDRILTQDLEGGFQIWDAFSGESILQFRGHSDRTYSADWSPDGDRIVSASSDGTIKVWNAADGTELHRLEGHIGRIDVAAWSPSGDHIVSASYGGTARVWDAYTGEEIQKFDQHGVFIFVAAWSPSGRYIAIGSADGTASVMDAFTGEVVQTYYGHDAAVMFIEWSQDGKQIMTTGPDGQVKVWNVSNETELLEIEGHPSAYWGLEWSPDGNRLARTFDDGSIEIYDGTSGSTLIKIEAHDSTVDWVAFSPSGDYIATSSRDGTAKVWDSTTGEILATYEGHVVFPTNTQWSPDGSKILSSSWHYDDTDVRIWDAMTGEELLVFSEHAEFWAVYWAAWAPDGLRVASISESGEALVWDATTGEVQLSLYPEGNVFNVTALAWSPDGDRIATHAFDGILRIWDSHTGEEMLTISGHPAQLYTVDWHPSGTRLLTGDVDGVFKIFDTGLEAEVFSARVSNYRNIALSPDGTRFATFALGGPIRIFSMWGTKDELMDLAHDCCLVRALTPEEREQFGLPAAGTGEE
jgi:WD40 repeat protein